MTHPEFGWNDWVAEGFTSSVGLLTPFEFWMQQATSGSVGAVDLARQFLFRANNFELGDGARGVDNLMVAIMASIFEGDDVDAHTRTQHLLEDLIEDAKAGDQRARRICGYLIGRLTELQKPLPASLGEMCSSMMAGGVRPPRRAGRPSYSLRDSVIFDAVHLLLKCFPDLRATRNDITETCSACSIVTEALPTIGVAISEKSVETIYRRGA